MCLWPYYPECARSHQISKENLMLLIVSKDRNKLDSDDLTCIPDESSRVVKTWEIGGPMFCPHQHPDFMVWIGFTWGISFVGTKYYKKSGAVNFVDKTELLMKELKKKIAARPQWQSATGKWQWDKWHTSKEHH